MFVLYKLLIQTYSLFLIFFYPSVPVSVVFFSQAVDVSLLLPFTSLLVLWSVRGGWEGLLG